MGCERSEPKIDEAIADALAVLRVVLKDRALKLGLKVGTVDYHRYVCGTLSRQKKLLQDAKQKRLQKVSDYRAPARRRD